MTNMIESLRTFLPALLTLAIVVAVLVAVNRLLQRGASHDDESDFRNKLIMLALSLAGLVMLLVAAPLEPDTQGQLLSFLGIVLSAAVALSSTTILGNVMAGIMLRAVGNFRVGDFVRVGDHFGRVTERGFFHTEIQTEERDLTTLPNLFLVTHPVNVIRNSGHILRAPVSLGYDVPRVDVERALLAAAVATELQDPFVHIVELGDDSVTYRVGGLLKDVKRLLTKRSVLRAEMMVALHGAGIEIVSPSFMNQRIYQTSERFMPRRVVPVEASAKAETETVVFDKAEEAETLESMRTEKVRLTEEIGALSVEAKKSETDDGRRKIEASIDRLKTRIVEIDEAIAMREAEKTNGSD
jgi:small conductance mechanosensitive channel